MTLTELFGPVKRAEWLFWGLTLAAMVLFLYPADESFFVRHLDRKSTRLNSSHRI